ncbi:MAG TPA: tetratricopeptide repeat protein [Thermoanaerobaculia bacterium]|nr:tetratricopeptide repeat protein [Thermoanaerobaculia bacterium]
MTSRFFMSLLFALAMAACTSTQRTASETVFPPEIAFLERRVADDPGDYTAWNRLGYAYLRTLRLTGNHDFLDGALRAAEASMSALGAPENRAGLMLLARARQANHEFGMARDLARQLLEIDPDNADYWAILSDSLLELGDYDQARGALGRMYDAGGSTLGSETRVSRQHMLHGRTAQARGHLEKALRHAQASPGQPENLAWCHWQLGELAFSSGDLDGAERHYDEALRVLPTFIPALGARGRMLAARGRIDAAIEAYEKATESDPVPPFVAVLSDLYRARGDQRRADALMRVVDEGAQSARDRRLDRRHLSLIYADRDRRLEEAYDLAVADYAERPDIYAADTLAWAALKTGRLDEARRAIAAATRLGTPDAKILYHAGMIARASGDLAGSRELLARAIALNPHFDFRQSQVARNALAEIAVR